MSEGTTGWCPGARSPGTARPGGSGRSSRRGPTRFLLALAVAAGVAGLCIAHSAPLRAQAGTNSFGGFAKDSNAPIDIESDSLEVQDAKKIAIFRGNVKAIQGGMTLRSRELRVKYAGDQKKTTKSAAGSGSQITHIRADGKVLITTDKDQNTTSDWADFDIRTQLVTIGGNVVLSQGGNVIKGDRLVIDLKTGRSRFEHDGGAKVRKRVKGLFMPGKLNQKQGATEPGSGSGANPPAPRQ